MYRKSDDKCIYGERPEQLSIDIGLSILPFPFGGKE